MGLTRINNQALTDVTSAGLPSGSVLQIVQNTFAPASNESTSNTSYQASGWNITVQKKQLDSKLLVTFAGGHQYLQNYAAGVVSTICQESGSSTFTASTTYASANDPASAYTFGMQQVYNATGLHTAPHSKNWLFDSSGNEFEAFRAFFRARNSGYTGVFFEAGHIATITVMEIAG